jgi:hypothetical protein
LTELKLVNTGGSSPVFSTVQHSSPKGLLDFINQSYHKAITLQISEIQDVLQAQLEHLVRNNVLKGYSAETAYEDCSHIDFHIELANNTFKLVPHNLYTLILSNNEFVEYEKLKIVSRYITKNYTYIYDYSKDTDHAGNIISNQKMITATSDGLQFEALADELY